MCAMQIKEESFPERNSLIWHIGQKVPKLEGRVLSFLADGDEMFLLLDAMKSSNVNMEAMRALESLTPSGSEFVNDPKRCAEFVREHRSSMMKFIAHLKKRLDVLWRARQALTEIHTICVEISQADNAEQILETLSKVSSPSTDEDERIREWAASKLDEAPGDFLKNFIQAVLIADGHNFEIMRPMINMMMLKYPVRSIAHGPQNSTQGS